VPLRTLTAVRYAVPLREGGSLPAVVEAETGERFVCKFRGAGQGPKVLVAEVIAGELARAAGLPVPEVALLRLDEAFGRTERDPEIQDILRASVGLNVGLRFLEPALPFDPVAAPDFAPPDLAADVVWLDAWLLNIDRTVRNPNLLVAPGVVRDQRLEVQEEDHDAGLEPRTSDLRSPHLWLIDHGVALFVQHDWAGLDAARTRQALPRGEQHVLLPLAGSLHEADARMRARLTPEVLDAVLDLVPDALLLDTPDDRAPDFPTADAFRDAFRRLLHARLDAPEAWLAPLEAARTDLMRAAARPLPYRR
jgi:hypothetical protein